MGNVGSYERYRGRLTVTVPTDLHGDARIIGDVVDMGAYENLCQDIRRVKPSCDGDGKLSVKVTTSLPEGTTVFISNGDRGAKRAKIKANGRGKVKWQNQSGQREVCASGCTQQTNSGCGTRFGGKVTISTRRVPCPSYPRYNESSLSY